MGEDNSWKVKTMVIGAVAGALFGVGVSYLLVQRAGQGGRQAQRESWRRHSAWPGPAGFDAPGE